MWLGTAEGSRRHVVSGHSRVPEMLRIELQRERSHGKQDGSADSEV